MKNNIPKSEIFSVSGIVVLVLAISVLGVKAGSLSPSSSPASTFYTLSQIFNPLASTSYDSSGITADQNGSLIEMLKYTNNNLNWFGVAGNTTYTSKAIQVGGTATVSYSRFGTDAASHGSMSAANDLLISGDFEVNGSVAFDGNIDTTFTQGSVLFTGSSGLLSQDNSKFFWDDSNDRIGIGTIAPSWQLHIYRNDSNNSAILAENDSTGGNAAVFIDAPTSNDARPFLEYLDAGTSKAAIGLERTNSQILGGTRNDLYITTISTNNILFGSNNTERMRLSAAGFFGIGTTAPSTKLEVQGTASASYGLFGTLQVGGFSSLSYNRFGTALTGHANYISSSNDLLISGDLEVDGSVSFAGPASVSGNFYLPNLGGSGGNAVCQDSTTKGLILCSSSIRYKDNVQDLVFDKEKLLSLRPVSYNWKNSGDVDTGLIAEEVYGVLPELTFRDNQGEIGGVRYDRLSVYLLKLFKEQELRLGSLDDSGNMTLGTSILSESNESLIASILDYFEKTLVKIQKLIAKEIITENITITTGITLIDEITGEPYCVVMSNGQLTTRPGECGQVSQSISRPEPEVTPEVVIEPTTEPTPEAMTDPEEIIPTISPEADVGTSTESVGVEVTEPPVIESTE